MRKKRAFSRFAKIGVAVVLMVSVLVPYTSSTSALAQQTTQPVLTSNPDQSLKLSTVSSAKIYEAENASMIGNAKPNVNHLGYSGTGFVDTLGTNGNGVSFAVTASTAGTYALDIRYADGTCDANTGSLELFVNDVSQGVIKMQDVGSWDQWWDETVNVNLSAGTDNIRLERTENCNTGAVNLDYITLKPLPWQTPGAVQSVQRDGNTFTFECDNAAVQLKVCADNIVKVWCEPTKIFARKYDSFSVVKENFDPKTPGLSENAGSYVLSTADLHIVINKSAFGLTYEDSAGNILTQSADSGAFRWDSSNEIQVNNKIANGESFWGLGEKTEAVQKNGLNMTMWSTDYLNGWQDAFTAKAGDGSWYLSDPHFVSSRGYSIFFDNTSRTQFDMGKSSAANYSFGSYNPMPGGELCYYFMSTPKGTASTNRVKALTTAFTNLVGKSFFAPKWAYGNLQSHYGYTQADVLNVAKTYQQKGIPLDAMMADIEYYYNQCSPTQVNSSNFPDMKGLISTLHSEGVKFGLIDDPNISAATTSTTDYLDGLSNNYFISGQNGLTENVTWPWGSANGVAASGLSGVVDFFNPAASTWWQNLHKGLLSDGLDMFWLDMNEPARYRSDWTFWNQSGKGYGNLAEMHNAYATADDKSMYSMMTQSGNRSFLMTRSGFTGTQRYASPWTGDISPTWTDMANQIRLGTGLSLSGFNYWGFDIGGFQDNLPSDYSNQFKRWIELSTFIPVHRFHYAGDTAREPWNFGSENIAKKYITLRYQLDPYFYSLSGDSIVGTGLEGTAGTGTGIPQFRPMLMEYPEDPTTYNMDSEFMSGPDLLVAPVVENSNTKNVYLPQGLWYDYNTGSAITTALHAGAWLNQYAAPEDVLPVFVKAGAIIPTMQPVQSLGNSQITQLTLDIYPLQSGDSRFVQYEDDGETNNYQKGQYATTEYTSKVSTDSDTKATTINIGVGARKGDYAVAQRSGIAKLHLSAFNVGAVAVNGYTQVDSLAALGAGKFYVDTAAKICYVGYKDDGTAKTISVKVTPPAPARVYSWSDVTGTYVKNAGFDDSMDLPSGSNASGWYEWHPDGQEAACGIDSNNAVSGNKCYFWSATAYKQSIHQIVNLPAGTYKVTAQVKVSNQSPNTCQMQLNGTPVVITPTGNYETVEGEVALANDGTLDIGFYADAPGNTSVQIDSVTLFRQVLS